MPFQGFLLHKSFLKELETQKEFLEDLMFFMIKGYMSLRTIKSIWLHYLNTCCVLGLSFHLGKFLWKKFYLPWCWKHYKPCATYYKWMSFNHLHLWPLYVKSCTWYVHHCARFYCSIIKSQNMFALGYLKQLIHLGQKTFNGATRLLYIKITCLFAPK
jgi:hypothetical protein